MTTDTNEWLSQYVTTFHNVYWKGPRRNILEKVRKLAGNENYILYVQASKSSKHIYHFIDEKTVYQDVADFPHLSICFSDGTIVKGLDKILKVADELHKLSPDGFVFALFDTFIDDETVTRIPSFWFDKK